MATSNGSDYRDIPSPSPRSSASLQAAAAVNAGLHQESSRVSPTTSSLRSSFHASGRTRSRSSVFMNLQLNDPALPAPGELQHSTDSSSGLFGPGPSPQLTAASPRSPLMIGRDPLQPRHGRQPSLGEIHQELEAESEAQVNRLLQIIHEQKIQLQQLQAQHAAGTQSAGDDSDPHSGPTSAWASFNFPLPPSPILSRPRTSSDVARAEGGLRRRSRTPSRTASRRMRSTSMSNSADQLGLSGRDECDFYKGETQVLARENQMLRQRIRDLERQLGELEHGSTTAAATHEPFQHSHLTHSTSASGEEPTGTPVAAAVATSVSQE